MAARSRRLSGGPGRSSAVRWSMWRTSRREIAGRRYLFFVARAAVDRSSAHPSYFLRLQSMELERLDDRIFRLSRYLGRVMIFRVVGKEARRAHRPMRATGTGAAVHAGLVLIGLLSPFDVPLAVVWSLLWLPLLVGTCAAAKWQGRRFYRRMGCHLTPLEVFGPALRRLVRRHPGLLPAAAVIDPGLRGVLVGLLGPFSVETLETAVLLADEFDGSAVELLVCAAHLTR